MTSSPPNESTRVPLRLWPGVIAAILIFAVFVAPVVVPDTGVLAVLGGLAGSALVLLWWLFFSRAPWSERIGAIVLMIVAVFATSRVVHPSIAGGMMGMMLPVMGAPVLALALVIWAVATRRRSTGMRRAWMVAAILIACSVFTLLRTGGIMGDGRSDLHWRWTKTPEERLLAQATDDPLEAATKPAAPSVAPTVAAPGPPPTAPPPDKPLADRPGGEPKASVPAPTAPENRAKAAAPAAVEPAPPRAADRAKETTEAEWPGFRGPERDGVVRGVRINTNWTASPPTPLWRRPIGPGWSSFAVSGDLFYTQEQRGDDEVVACYRVSTGEPVWRHRDAVRFWESNGGAGPRATPSVSGGRVYTLGATGVVNALDARTGAVVWSRNASSDTGAKLPGWGFAGSPLVIGDALVVAASGRLVAYEIATGKPRWLGPVGGGGGYSSPQLATIRGVEQIVLPRGGGAAGFSPANGALLWERQWDAGVSIVQPAVAPDGDLLIAGGDAMGGNGLRRIAVSQGAAGWTVEDRWTSRGLKPYFNDFVIHKGHAFGFDGSILSCIDLQDGSRKWKGGRYGNGQLVLLPDEDVLLVLSEDGEIALVSATPEKFTELARVPALEGKTWNHPVLVRDVLLVRNGEQMAAFRLSLASQ
jgi:outer membrane protein assembly factor BamB